MERNAKIVEEGRIGYRRIVVSKLYIILTYWVEMSQIKLDFFPTWSEQYTIGHLMRDGNLAGEKFVNQIDLMLVNMTNPLMPYIYALQAQGLQANYSNYLWLM